MLSIGPSFFILGLVVASVTAQEASTHSEFSTTSKEFNYDDNIYTTVTPFNTKTNITATTNTTAITNSTSVSRTTSTMIITDTISTIAPSTTKRDKNITDGKPTPSPMSPSKSPTSVTKTTDKSTTATPQSAGDSIGIVILVMIILIAVVFGVACYFAQKRRRHYSVDLTSRPDEANIPLSVMEPELPVDTVSQNGLQTFESTETTTKEPQEPEAKPEVQEEQKAEADKSVVDPSAESAAPAPSPDSAESAAPAPSPDSAVDKPKEDVVEQSPPAPVEPSVEEKTDDESVISNKTSVESLKETNENNSNNADFSQKRDWKSSNVFWDVPLDCPV